MTAAATRTGRTRGVLLVVFLVLTLVVINVSNWFVLSRVEGSLETELGLRLTTVAATTVSAATSELMLDPAVANDAFVRGVLEEIADRHDLDDVFLVDTKGIPLLALSGPASDAETVVGADLDAFERAVLGSPSVSRTMEIDGTVRKAAYAPVQDWDGAVEAVLGVTAGGGFFASLPALNRTLTGVTIGGVALVVVLGAVFWGMSRRLAATETALGRSETLRSMGMMAAGVAHEIRNPLAIISGTAERLRRKYPDVGADPLFDFIPEEVERLNGIIEGYLRFARDEPMSFVECDLRGVVARSAKLIGPEIGTGGVTVGSVESGEPLPVRADPQRLQQVMLNLLLNAAQAMPEGGRIAVEVERDGDLARIAVTDEGPGFSERALESAFDPFFTTKEQGSGLGLAMVKRIVVVHGGEVRLANRPGGGAIVTVRLPAARSGREK